jgi:hypothetical protein
MNMYADALAECDEFDPVTANITCNSFISRSKGKGRSRRPREVVLVKYYRRFYSFKNAPLDTWAHEIFAGIRETTANHDADYLREQIKDKFRL